MPSAPDTCTIRPAVPDELPRLWEIRAASDAPDPFDPPPPGPVPAVLAYLLPHGTLLVAERAGHILGFAGRIDGEETCFLTDLFVEPGLQSAGIGRVLLHAVFSNAPPRRFTVASTDPRAIALYARAGMTPRWPNLNLFAESEALRALKVAGVELEPCEASDPWVHEQDRKLGGRFRPQDFAFFATEHQGTCFWANVDGRRAGYAVIRYDAASGPRADTVTIGPVGGDSAQVALAATLAAVQWAQARAQRLEISVPGPHLALPDLLSAGFRIEYVETFCSTSPLLVHPEWYLGSGGDLF